MRTPSRSGSGTARDLIPKGQRVRRLTLLAGALAGVLVVVGVGVGTTPASSPFAARAAAAATIPPGQSTPIVGTPSGRCLEVPNSSTT
ncbi:alpha-L-arabinofuranosidase, partial [Micromonospora sp. NPDC047753]